MNGTEAVDICLIISASMSNSNWRFIRLLDGDLRELGVGTGEQKKRYCLVMFGGNGSYITARFLHVDGQIFFPYNDFTHAGGRLQRTGSIADGYEALNFTVLNAPFRESPNVAKIILLVTDQERSVLPSQTNLTNETILHLLNSHSIVMDTVVPIHLKIEGESTDHDILGIHSYNQTSLVLPRGGFEISSNQTILFTQASGQIFSDYVALSLILQGSPWSLDLLNSEDHNNNILSFVNAFISMHNILPETLCEKCQCVTGPELVCEQGVDQDECTCLSQRTEVEVRHSQPLHLCIQHVQYHVADRHCYNNNFIHFYILSSIPLCLFSPLLLLHQISVGQSCQLLQYLRLT